MSDFFLPIPMSAPVDTALIGAFQKVMGRAQQTLSWLPNITGESSDIFYGGSAQFPRLNPNPEGLDDTQAAQWTEVYRAASPIVNQAIRGEMQAAAVEGARLAADTNFWETVYRIDLAAATAGISEVEKAWDEFWQAVDAVKMSRDATVITLKNSNAMLAAMGADAPGDLLSNQSSLTNRTNDLVAQTKAAISPLGSKVTQNAGLGIAPLVIAGITAAVVIAVTASVWAIAHELAAVQSQANDHAQAVFDAQTKYDQDLAERGIITQDELMRRRANTAQQMDAVVNAQGASAVGSGLAKAGLGAALGIGALALGVVGVLYMLRKGKAAPAAAPATNPRRRLYR